MDWMYLGLVLIPLALVTLVLVAWRAWPGSARALLATQQLQFEAERRRLEDLFFQTAAASGKPRGLRWKECQWSDLIAWLRERSTGRLHALVGVTISFEAIEGGDMEGVEAVGNLRDATAVFYFDGAWTTAGRVVFNLNPDEAVIHFKDGYDRVETSPGAKS